MSRGFDRFMVDVAAATHPKVRRLKRAGKEVRWAWFHGVLPIAARAPMRGSFCVGALGADEHDVAAAADVSVQEARKALEIGRGLGLLERDDDGIEWVHDWDDYQVNPRVDQTATRRKQLQRDPALRTAIRERDGDLCRYCGVEVVWTDRRSPAGGTYDHVDPAGQNSLDNLVVACRGCNGSKGRRTPAEAGLDLTPVKSGSSPGLSRDLTEEEEEVEGEENTPPDPPASGGELPPVPRKPSGKRRTEHDRFDGQVKAYAAAAFPSLPDPNRWQLVRSSISSGAETHDAIAAFVGQWTEGAAA